LGGSPPNGDPPNIAAIFGVSSVSIQCTSITTICDKVDGFPCPSFPPSELQYMLKAVEKLEEGGFTAGVLLWLPRDPLDPRS